MIDGILTQATIALLAIALFVTLGWCLLLLGDPFRPPPRGANR